MMFKPVLQLPDVLHRAKKTRCCIVLPEAVSHINFERVYYPACLVLPPSKVMSLIMKEKSAKLLERCKKN